LANGITVVEVNQPHAHARQRLGKSDPIDAELAARAALSGTATAVRKQTSGIVEAIRQLSVARAGALKARTAALQQLDDLVITAPEQLRGELRRGRHAEGTGRSLPTTAPRHRTDRRTRAGGKARAAQPRPSHPRARAV